MATGSPFPYSFKAKSVPQAATVLLGRFLYVLIFLMAAPSNARSAARVRRRAAIRNHRAGRRLEHPAGISRQNRGLADCAVPGSRHTHDAQVLDRARSGDGANANGHVHEEFGDSRRSLAHQPVRSGAVEPGCPALTLKPVSMCESAAVRRLPTEEPWTHGTMSVWAFYFEHVLISRDRGTLWVA